MNIEMNYFDKWITDELLRIHIIDTLEDIQMVSWFPPAPYDSYSCAIRLKTCISNKQVICNGFFENIKIVGNYINVFINNELLSNKVSSYIIKQSDCYGITNIRCMYESIVAVEHTSQTPSYPINLATFRGSVIGNAIVSLLKKYKIHVSVHYLVADTSRNIDLILKNYSVNEIFTWGKEAKSDHLCGALFCNALSKIKKIEQELNVRKMFPFVSTYSFETANVIKGKYSKCDLKEYCEFCLQGHRQTLKEANINFDVYDYESKVIKDIDYDIFLDSETAKENLSKDKISYLWVNCAYYSHLAKDYSAILSIVNNRQKQKINEVLTHFKKDDIPFKALFYGDVKIAKDDHAMVDSIKRGRFHSVDEYVKEASAIMDVDCKITFDSLKLLLLSKKYCQPISLDMKLYNDLKKYVEIVVFIRKEIDNMKKTNRVSAHDALLARYLINAFSIFTINSICSSHSSFDCNLHKIVAYVEMIVKYMRKEYCQSVLINSDIAIASKQVLENALSLLGI